MGYAVIFLCFFSIDILVTGQFMTFGMIPMSNLKAAVTAYAVYRLLKAKPSVTVKSHLRILNFWAWFYGFLTFNFLIEWANTIVNPESWIGKAVLSYIMDSTVGYFLIGITLIGVLAGRFLPQKPWIGWLGFSGIGLIFSLSIMLSMRYLSSRLSLLLWWYSGIVDLPMLFCLLMTVHSLIREETYEFG